MAPRHHRDSRSLRTVVATVAAALLAAAIVAPALAAPPGPSSIALPNGWAPEGITAGPGATVCSPPAAVVLCLRWTCPN